MTGVSLSNEKIANPPSPPFRKGGLGGFESYFLNKFFAWQAGIQKHIKEV